MNGLRSQLLGGLLMIGAVPANVITIPADYPAVQTGIDSAAPGDTVLILPGTYYEHITFRGKNITVGSSYFISGDTAQISRTILDGSGSGTVATFDQGEDSTAILCGVTITNGYRNDQMERFYGGGITVADSARPTLKHLIVRNNTGYYGGGIAIAGTDPRLEHLRVSGNTARYGGGIFCHTSTARISQARITGNISTSSGGGLFGYAADLVVRQLEITDNQAAFTGGGISLANSDPDIDSTRITTNQTGSNGGGIFMIESSPSITQTLIDSNTAGDHGGGVYCTNTSNPTLLNVRIRDNAVSLSGGGIYCSYNSHPVLSGVTIAANSAGATGGGLACTYYSAPDFDPAHRSNIYLNRAEPTGSDLYTDSTAIQTVVLDTFTVMIPTRYQAAPLPYFTFDILHARLSQGIPHLYVDPAGTNTNDGQSAATPLRTILFALSRTMADSLHPCTLHLADGRYSASTNGEYFPIQLLNHVSLVGASRSGTILDADNRGSVLIIDHLQGNRIAHLTLTGGSAAQGGGIACLGSDPVLVDLRISGNTAELGGGVYCLDSGSRIDSTIITQNTASLYGGGLYLDLFSTPGLRFVRLTHNRATISAGGIFFSPFSVPVWDTTSRSSVYLNTAGPTGNDLYAELLSDLTVVLDTFTVLNPTDYHAFPRNAFTFDIRHGIITQVSADLFVDTDGDNANSGLSPAEPLQTITFALAKILADAANPHTIFLAPGVYSPALTGEQFPLNLRSHVALVGAAETEVILDAEQTGGVIEIDSDLGVRVENLTLTGGLASQGGGMRIHYANPHCSNLIITGNSADNYGGGVVVMNSAPVFRNVRITLNQAFHGGGLYLWQSDPDISGLLIARNTVSGNGNRGGGIYLYQTPAQFLHTTLANNYAGTGGGIYCYASHIRLVNSLLWHNFTSALYFDANAVVSSVVVAFSDLEYGSGSILTNNNGTVHWLDGNLQSDPLFVDVAAGDYRLESGSPCIDSGSDFYVWYFDTLVNIPPEEYNGTAPDMGACEYEALSAGDQRPAFPAEFRLHQNVPNPFNPATTIRYELPFQTQVSLTVYDLGGRKVRMLETGRVPPGFQSIVWDGRNDNGYTVASGVYFVRLQAGEFVQVRKLVLLR